MKKLLFIWQELSASFWFIPIMMLLLAIGSAFGFIYDSVDLLIETTLNIININ